MSSPSWSGSRDPFQCTVHSSIPPPVIDSQLPSLHYSPFSGAHTHKHVQSLLLSNKISKIVLKTNQKRCIIENFHSISFTRFSAPLKKISTRANYERSIIHPFLNSLVRVVNDYGGNSFSVVGDYSRA